VVFSRRSGDVAPGPGDGDLEWTSGDDGGVAGAVPVLRSSLGPDTVVSGRLSFNAPTRIDGTLRGEVRATDLLVVGERGFIEGAVRAPRLIILGEVRGDIIGAERVEIGASGRLIGTVEASSLVVKDGGCLDGDCRITPPAVRAATPAAPGAAALGPSADQRS